MSYKINRTDGTLLVDLIDGRIDVDTTDITLVGRNYTGYGEAFNENFVKMLENFRSTTPPSRPLMGQLWFDSSEGRLKVFSGTTWKATDTTIVSPVQPELVAGDVWVDNNRKQVYFSDGTDTILAGPNYTQEQGRTGFDTVTIIDTFGIERSVARFSVGNNTVALVAQQTFTAASGSSNDAILSGFDSNIKSGWNISSNYPNFAYHGVADTSNNLKDSTTGTVYAPSDFVDKVNNNTLNGSIHVKNDGGIVYGLDSDFVIRVEENSTVLRNRIPNSYMRFQVKEGFFDKDAIYVKAIEGSEYRIGIWNNLPQYTLDLTGDMRITGDLLVEGETTSLSVSTLEVEDINIELAKTNDSTLLDNQALDGAGMIIKGAQDDKSITYSAQYDQFTLTNKINLPSGGTYRIANNDILSETTLNASVTSAVGLTQVGVLQDLFVDNLYLNSNTFESQVSGLTVKSAGDINVVDQNNASATITIKGVADPTDDNDVATKSYVDTRPNAQDEKLFMDITGLANADIALVLEDLYPSANKDLGAYAYVHCLDYTGSTIEYDGDDGLTKTFVAVDKNGVENQSVLQDISFAATSETVTFSASRTFKRFRVVSPSQGVQEWQFDTDLPSSV